jgi:nicotinamidase-related amidase
MSFAPRGGPWPVHCVRGTRGAALHADLRLPTRGVTSVLKGTDARREQYSAFDGTGLAEQLRRAGVKRAWIAGLALDVCVRATVLDAINAGFEVHVISDATRPVDVHPGDGDEALRAMSAAGAVIERAAAHG